MINSGDVFLTIALAGAIALPASVGVTSSLHAASASDLNQDANRALRTLYSTNPLAQQISGKARIGSAGGGTVDGHLRPRPYRGADFRFARKNLNSSADCGRQFFAGVIK